MPGALPAVTPKLREDETRGGRGEGEEGAKKDRKGEREREERRTDKKREEGRRWVENR